MNTSYLITFGSGYLLYMLYSFLPQYIEQRFGEDLQHSSDISVLPPLFRIVILLGAGMAADRLLARGSSTSTVRIVMNSISTIGPSALLVMVPFVATSAEVAVVLSASVACSGFGMFGCALLPLDLFPEAQAGTFYGVFNVFSNIPGLVAPYVTGRILDDAGCPSISGGNDTTDTVSAACLAGWDRSFYLAVIIDTRPRGALRTIRPQRPNLGDASC